MVFPSLYSWQPTRHARSLQTSEDLFLYETQKIQFRIFVRLQNTMMPEYRLFLNIEKMGMIRIR